MFQLKTPIQTVPFFLLLMFSLCLFLSRNRSPPATVVSFPSVLCLGHFVIEACRAERADKAKSHAGSNSFFALGTREKVLSVPSSEKATFQANDM